MELVVDTNIIVAALLRPGSTRKLIFNPFLKLYGPEQLEAEMLKNKEKFKTYVPCTEEEFFETIAVLLRQIEIIPLEVYKKRKAEAKQICARDETDWPFAALALELDIAIWSNDPDLKKGQQKIPVFTTQELFQTVG